MYAPAGKSMKQPIDLKTWNRREHFEYFFKQDVPFWSVTANVECTGIYRWCKEHGRSFAVAYHWASLKAANGIEAMRMRIENDHPVLFDAVHASTTVARPDGTFGFSFNNFDPNFEAFHESMLKDIKRIEGESGLKYMHPEADVIFYTVLRKVRFTSAEHSFSLGSQGAIPCFAFGEAFEENGKMLLPHSIRVNHALVDGQHVSRYYEQLEQIMNAFR
ncbi:MAG TPA: chloramphenicol acetyltransferase [Planctomycetaceae bacterium]|nr:chloramphenicol acetyltransferase [Planctomycetaceae bacterium]